MKALLLSGGLDSTAIAYIHRPEFAFSIDYGQLPAKAELASAEQICSELGIQHIIISVPSDLGIGDLAGRTQVDIGQDLKCTEWWPFRNQFLLTIAAMKAVTIGVDTLLFGSVKTDCIHADGKKSFFDAISKLFDCQEGKLKIETPAIDLTTSELIQNNQVPQDLLGWCHSCHVSNLPCGKCRGCHKHFEVLDELDWLD